MIHIPKEELQTGAYYFGKCRNAKIARWDGARFIHWRTKFTSTFLESIKCPEDDQVYDVFYATELVTYSVPEIPLDREVR